MQGLVVFAEQSVDVAVVVVGMLGRRGATNVVHGDLAVVTNIELHHTELTSPTRYAIAAGKARVVKPGSVVVRGESDPVLSPLFLCHGQIRTGRMETAAFSPRVIVDGAHNPAAASALREAICQRLTERARGLVFGAWAGRGPRTFLQALHSHTFAHIVLSRTHSPRAAPALDLLACIEPGSPPTTVCPVLRDVLQIAHEMAGLDALVLATGSRSLLAAPRYRTSIGRP